MTYSIETLLFIFGTIFTVTVLLILWCILEDVKNEITLKNHTKIIKAISAYQRSLINKYQFDQLDNVTYDDMEDYNKTFKRFWDWGYTRILPKEKFELIKPFLDVSTKTRKDSDK